MGGFLTDRKSGSALNASTIPDLTAESHPELLKLDASWGDPPKEHETQPWILVTESEILDKSKGDRWFGETCHRAPDDMVHRPIFGALGLPSAQDTG